MDCNEKHGYNRNNEQYEVVCSGSAEARNDGSEIRLILPLEVGNVNITLVEIPLFTRFNIHTRWLGMGFF